MFGPEAVLDDDYFLGLLHLPPCSAALDMPAAVDVPGDGGHGPVPTRDELDNTISSCGSQSGSASSSSGVEIVCPPISGAATVGQHTTLNGGCRKESGARKPKRPRGTVGGGGRRPTCLRAKRFVPLAISGVHQEGG